ncbi:MAG TPA: CHASE domain-containing protein [Novosphingobium sp.]|nr:CHASE domain-containing protein [Novosphingobium sp.]
MDKALLERVEKQAWFHKYPRGWPFLLFVLASMGTLVSVMAIERANDQRRELELDRDATEIASALQRRTTENVALLRVTAALFETRDEVTEADFREFMSGLQTNGNQHGSLGIGWARALRPAEVPMFELSQWSGDQSGIIVQPRPGSGQRLSVPIVYLSPNNAVNARAIGFDMYSEWVRREALDAAMRLNRPVATGRVRLIQDSGGPDTAGFLIYMPVMAGRNSGLVKGFVYSPFRAGEFLAAAAELYSDRDVEVALFDQHHGRRELLALRSTIGENGISIERRLTVGNREWILRVSNKQANSLTALSRLTLFFGAMAALLVMAIGRLITKRAMEDRQVLEWLSRQAAIRTSLTRELNHRVKNTLANVLSIAALTRRRSKTIDDFTDSLTARIKALSATHDLLSQSDWSNAPLGDVVRSELAPYMEGAETHVEMSGPDIALAPNDAMSLGLAIHELATNAAKYGALSTPEGRVHIDWRLMSPALVEINWREEGGPLVVVPSTRGFGRDLIEKIVAHELKSEVKLEFDPRGVTCTLHIPIRKVGQFEIRSGRRDGAE